MGDLSQFKPMSISRIGDDDPMCPHEMVRLKNEIIQAFIFNAVERVNLIVRYFLIPERGFVDIHVDTETPHHDIWVTIIDRNRVVVRRHAKGRYFREKYIFSVADAADGYRQAYLNKIIAGALFTP